MTAIVLTSKSSSDSKLHLEVPVDLPDTEFEVQVTVRPKPAEGVGWPPGYSDVFNSIDDETFTVHPQPPMPPALEIDCFSTRMSGFA